jgi:hypothetical protein
LAIAYGIRVTEDNDPYIILVEKISRFFADCGPPGATLVDLVPLLRRLPSWVKIFPSLNFARESYPLIKEFYEITFAAVKRDMASGTPEVSFVRRMLEEKELASSSDGAANITEDDIKGAAATL